MYADDIEQLVKRRRIIFLLGLILGLALLVGIITFYVIDSKKTAKLDILVAPSIAEVKIDQKVFSSEGEVRLIPGRKQVTVSADGFGTQTLEADLVANETSRLYIVLLPDAEHKNWYEEHSADQLIASRINDYNTSQSQAEYLETYPVTRILPIVVVEVDPETYDWTEYRIDYGEFKGCKRDFCLKITDSTGGNREAALNKIRDGGFNPDDYEVIYEYTPVTEL